MSEAKRSADEQLIAAESSNMIRLLMNNTVTLEECARQCEALAMAHVHLEDYWRRYAATLRRPIARSTERIWE